MAQKTLTQLRSSLATLLGIGATDGNNSATLTDYLNWAGRRIWNRYPWPDRMKNGTVSTVAPYSTGTVAVTNGSTGITFSGSTLTSGMAARKFTVALGGPWYRLSSVNTGAGTAVLDRAYDEATDSAASFYIYQDEYDLTASVVGTVKDVRIHSSGSRGSLDFTTLKLLDDVQFLPTIIGIPSNFTATVRTTAGTRRLRVWPIPQDTYWLEYRYLSEWTDLSADGDTPVLPQNMEELLLKVALQFGSYLADGKEGPSDADIEALMKLWWRANPEVSPKVGMRSGLDSPVARGLTMDLTGLTS